MPEAETVSIGRLRWRVTLATRQQAPQTGGAGIMETPIAQQSVHADIQPVGALTFWGMAGEQVDGPITHRVFIRWVDSVPNTDAVYRTTVRRDGSERTETFRVRRWKEIAGRKRFVILECELEDSV